MKIDNELLKQISIKPLIDTLKLEKISDEEYFSDNYSNYISNSRLGLLKTKGAQAFFDGLKNDYNPSFEFGRIKINFGFFNKSNIFVCVK